MIVSMYQFWWIFKATWLVEYHNYNGSLVIVKTKRICVIILWMVRWDLLTSCTCKHSRGGNWHALCLWSPTLHNQQHGAGIVIINLDLPAQTHQTLSINTHFPGKKTNIHNEWHAVKFLRWDKVLWDFGSMCFLGGNQPFKIVLLNMFYN